MMLHLGRVHISAAALIPLAVLSLFNPPEYVGAMLFCAMLHETGHLIALKAVGAQVCRIEVMMFGAQIKTGGHMCCYGADALVYAAGAAANFIGAVCAYVTYLYFPLTEVMFLIFSNLFYAFFNMTPIRGLDGGGFLESLLLMRFEPGKVWKIIEIVSLVFILLLFFASLWVITVSKSNFSLLFVVIYLFINL